MEIEAVIFDLDGVIVHTDHNHYLAWRRLCAEEGIPFDEELNDKLRGVSRMACMDIIMEKAARAYSPEEKMELAERKNGYYRQSLYELTERDVPRDVKDVLLRLKRMSLKLAIGSSSRNAAFIVERLGLEGLFDVIVDGNAISYSKPHPEVFLQAAERLGVQPSRCLVVEDAAAGVEAAISGGMKVAAIGSAAMNDSAAVPGSAAANDSVSAIVKPDYRLHRLGDMLMLPGLIR
ncbi:beta-phosphoglucomutase [Paenibacillus sp. J5C2022]|uniref:beta-phosphoglucomutase n=1 Tax=Paenibacillus sp. J5C2022 TaxID=2977129 RepID=UPI0021D35EB1|nr:beta-phosphoglucomutase [Paenibacillus sp. J5C2022]